MTLTNWNWRYPVELQDVPWDCAAASLTWCLNAAGWQITEAQVVAGLGPTRISPAYGLLDATGEGIVDWLATIGISADNNAEAAFIDVAGAAGHQPMMIGGRAWCHWTAVRMSSLTAGYEEIEALALANPAPGYMGIEQLLYEPDFQELGPFSAVWLTSW